ncbi:MAG: hypothetical protein P8R54_01835 [Myxococcota bacterium]|nr:hypothetical protein [Myxococcota bacterium]
MAMKFLTLLLLSACDPSVQSYSEEGTIYQGDTPEDRFDNALSGVSSEKISFEASELLENILGEASDSLASDAPEKVKGVDTKYPVANLLEDEVIRAALNGSDEAAAAKLVRDAGMRIIILHSKVASSLDRNNQVINRLYRHDHLEYFQLLRVSDGLLYYTVRPSPAVFPPQLAYAAIEYLKLKMAGEAVTPFPDVQSPEGAWTFAAVLRDGGKELSVAFARNPKLQGVLDELADDLERDHRRNVEGYGFPRLSEHIGDGLTVELHYIYERAYIEPRDDSFLSQYFEMGIDGAFVLREIEEENGTRLERGALPGAASFTQSHRTADAFLRATAKLGRMSEKRPWRAKDAWLESFRSIHFRQEADGRLVHLYRGVPALPMGQVSLAAVKDGILASGEWYIANLADNGQVTYKFWPHENRYSSEYNFVRHTLSTWNLVQAWELDPRPEFLAGAKKALEYTDSHLVKEDIGPACEKVEWCDPERLDVSGQMAFYSYNDNQKLGSVVVNLLGMVDLARATGSDEWDEQMREMGRFVKFMQRADGSFQGYYVDKDHSYYTFVNDIVPGEAALSLIYLAEYFDDDSWMSGLPAYWTHYEPWFWEREKKKDTTAPWPMNTYHNDTRLELVQFGPWTVMAANAYHRRTGDEKVAAFGLDIARWMIDSYMWTEDRAPFPDFVGGYYKMSHELPAMQAFCYAEGTAAAYDLALRYDPEQSKFFGDATHQTMRFALQMQYNAFNTYAFTRPEQVRGGTRYAMNETKVRIDYVYHAQSSMVQWYYAAQKDPNLSEVVRDGPAIPGQLRSFEDELALAIAQRKLAAAAEDAASGDAE